MTVASHDAVPDGTPALNPGGGAGDADGDGRGDGAIDYVSIDLAGTTDDAVENATITFEVPASKLEARGVSPDEVRLYRFHDGEWRTLNTTALGNGTYEAVTPGFSVFAVGSENATENAADDASATTEDEAGGTTATGTDAGGTATPDPSDASAPTAADETETTETGAPGFGVLAAFAALLAVTTRVLRR
ncbi:PGF-pre-PGF domain-containing protein [Halogeometricum sp. CBA1124]|uniref:PGF-pre-PGF domain-containing protein n=1 Tax=Halogeometricum sp. CBA1124 TaxID=2668071 RepID=UPI00174AE162